MQHSNAVGYARSYLEGGQAIPAGTVAASISDSWTRCRAQGLDPGIKPDDTVVSFAQIQHAREELRNCRRLALTEMQALYAQIPGPNFILAFADRHGLIIDTISDTHFSRTKAGKSIIPGSAWHESAHGTNALGLTVIHGRASRVYGSEHYFSDDAHLSCIAAPIFNMHGQMIGALDASCANATRQQHTEVLVKMAATQVSNSLFLIEQPGFYVFAFHPRAEYLDTLSTGLIAVSDDGEIISVNRYGKAFLDERSSLTGHGFETVFNCAFGPMLQRLLAGDTVQVRDQIGGSVFMQCRQVARGAARATRAASGAVENPHHKTAEGFIAADPKIQESLGLVARATRLGMPIHIFGETGTGKELMAREVHRLSQRSGPFIAVNCGAIPEALFISELFGYEPGAYTNANRQGAPGLIRQADKGTLFLDEVAEIPLAAQAVLLRFLDNMEVQPLGGGRASKVNVQIVSATNHALEKNLNNHTFRSDLLFRLNALTITLPPLHERQDFDAITRYLLAELSPGSVITDAGISRLQGLPWTGNIRQLRNYLQRLVVFHADGSPIDEALIGQHSQDTLAGTASQACRACAGHPLKEAECLQIRASYEANHHNISQTARQLNLSRTTVYKHLETARSK
ncbi:sigma 54-interacting transcriptional regulator [Castellaniella sp. FW104-16D08]|uniref:sigma-54-dependent Fis family transcriptional regulator n=1 Tax=unclassified Castellaniella TaxID=2617606 RepID=UPI003315FEF5